MILYNDYDRLPLYEPMNSRNPALNPTESTPTESHDNAGNDRTTLPATHNGQSELRRAALGTIRFLVRNLPWLSMVLLFYFFLNVFVEDWECCWKNLAGWFSSAPGGLAAGASGGFCSAKSEGLLAGFTPTERLGFCGAISALVGATVGSRISFDVREACAHAVCN